MSLSKPKYIPKCPCAELQAGKPTGIGILSIQPKIVQVIYFIIHTPDLPTIDVGDPHRILVAAEFPTIFT